MGRRRIKKLIAGVMFSLTLTLGLIAFKGEVRAEESGTTVATATLTHTSAVTKQEAYTVDNYVRWAYCSVCGECLAWTTSGYHPCAGGSAINETGRHQNSTAYKTVTVCAANTNHGTATVTQSGSTYTIACSDLSSASVNSYTWTYTPDSGTSTTATGENFGVMGAGKYTCVVNCNDTTQSGTTFNTTLSWTVTFAITDVKLYRATNYGTEELEDGMYCNGTNTWISAQCEVVGNASGFSLDASTWGSNSFKITENGTYTMYAKESTSGTVVSKTFTVDCIDKTAPTIDSISYSNDDIDGTITVNHAGHTWTSKDVTYTINTTDDLSGIQYYLVDGSPQSGNTFTASEGGTHTIVAYDNANNASTTFYITSCIDKTVPKLTVSAKTSDSKTYTASSSSKTWTNKAVTLTVTNSVTSASGTTYKWYKDGNLISGATSTTYTVSDEGSHVYKCVATSGAGSSSEVSSYTYYDKTVPTVSIKADTTTGSSSYTSKDVTLTATASDSASGIKSYQWYKGSTAISGATSSTYKISSTDSGSVYKCTVTDNAGNSATSSTLTVYVDKSTPSLTISAKTSDSKTYAASSTTKTWTNKAVTLTVANSVTSVSGTTYQWYKDDTAISGATDVSYTVPDESNHVYKCVATTGAGLTANVSTYTYYDKTVPTVSIKASTTTSATAYTSKDVTLTVTASDGTSGIKGYQWYKGSTAISGATASTYTVTSTEVGTTFKCIVTDNAGNTKTVSQTVYIDKATPSLTLTSETSDNKTYTQKTWTNKAVTLTIANSVTASSGTKYQWYKGSTAISGATGTSYTVTDEGSYAYKCVATTGAGLTSNVSITVNYDVTAPTVGLNFANTDGTYKGTETFNDSTKWSNTSVTYTVTDSDANSGIKSITINPQYVLGGNVVKTDIRTGSGTSYSTTVSSADLKALGVTNAYYKSVIVTVTDNAGNVTTYEVPAYIGTETPSVGTIKLDGTAVEDKWYKDTTTKTISADVTSVYCPIRYVEILIDGVKANSKDVTGDTFTDSISTTLTGSTDADGKVITVNVKTASGLTTTKTYTYKNDITAPTVSTKASVTTSATSYTNKDVTLTCTATDSESGIKGYQWYKDGTLISGATASTYKVTTSEAGTVFKCVVTDNVGNTSESSQTVYVDKVVPVATIDASIWHVNASGTVLSKVDATEKTWYPNSDFLENYYNDLMVGFKITNYATISSKIVKAELIIDSTSHDIMDTISDSGICQISHSWGSGKHTYKFKFTTGSGLVGESEVKEYWMDYDRPSTPTISVDNTTTYTNSVNVTIGSTDATSGIDSYAYIYFENETGLDADIDYVTELSKTAQASNTFTFNKNGIYVFYVKDVAGNYSYGNGVKITNCDNSAPEVVIDDADVNRVEYRTETSISVSVADDFKIATVELQKDGSTVEVNNLSEETTTTFNKNYTFCENGTYKVIAIDEAGNTTEKSVTITNIDTEAPTITDTITSSDTTHRVEKLVLKDNAKLKTFEIYLNGNLQLTLDLSTVANPYTQTCDLNNNGLWRFVLYDEAGNTAETKFVVNTIVKTYGLDEEDSLFHYHAGDKNTKAKCYQGEATTTTTTYTTTETVKNMGLGKCGYCGKYYILSNGSGYCSDCNLGVGPINETKTVTKTKSVTTYAMNCGYEDAEIIGTLKLVKDLGADYKLRVENSGLEDNVEITSYAWVGEDNAATEDYPSVYPNGAKPSDVDTITDAEIVVPDFGVYTCTVTWKDTITGIYYTEKFSYKVNDFDLTAPEVTTIKTSHNETYTKTGDVFAEDSDFGYYNGQTVTLSLADNMSLGELDLVSFTHLYDSSKDETYVKGESYESSHLVGSDQVYVMLNKSQSEDIEWYFKESGTYKFKLYDNILKNEYDFEVVVNHSDWVAPTITELSFEVGDWATSDEVTVTAEDDFEIAGYELSTKDNLTSAKITSKTNVFTITDNGSYYIYIKDAAGNVSKQNFEVDWIDHEGPNLDGEDADIYITVNGQKYSANAGQVLKFTISAEKNAQYATVNVKTLDTK